VALSEDQKPENSEEKKRIIARGGRVAACQGMHGEDIGPQRVWLKHQDVPGLAMTRSFGVLIAASVGVIPNPDVWERDIESDDAFIILASDGVWEFIENQEAVDIVASCKGVHTCHHDVVMIVGYFKNTYYAHPTINNYLTKMIEISPHDIHADVVLSHVSCQDATLAAKKLTDEATKRWQKEEEVIDDITAVIAYFQ
jgi:serine/threonine protein phosphatase PrpC